MSVSTFQPARGAISANGAAITAPDELWAAERCREALLHLEQAIQAPPLQRSKETERAARNLMMVQEAAAEWERRETALWRVTNERLEAVLALIASKAYPYPGVGRKQLVQAHEEVRAILVDGLL